MASIPSSGGDGTDTNKSSGQDSGLTLRRLEVWTDEWRLRMRMMSLCVDGARSERVGNLEIPPTAINLIVSS